MSSEPQNVETFDPTDPGLDSKLFKKYIESLNAEDKWDDTTSESHILPSGRHITVKKRTKHFDDISEAKYTRLEVQSYHENGKEFNALHTLHRIGGGSHGSTSGSYDEETSRYLSDLESANSCRHILQLLCSPNFKFVSVECDPEFTADVSHRVAFGSYTDARRRGVAKIPEAENASEEDIGLVQPFLPGRYKCTKIVPIKNCDPFVIYHHEEVSASKIMDQILLMIEDYGQCAGSHNVINRYDWCQGCGSSPSGGSDSSDEDKSAVPRDSKKGDDQKGPDKGDDQKGSDKGDDQKGSDKRDDQKGPDKGDDQKGSDKGDDQKGPDKGDDNDERESFKDRHSQMIYFVPTEYAKKLAKMVENRKQSEVIPELYQFQHPKKSDGTALGIDVGCYNSGDYLYGKLFEDEGSKKYFALVINLYMGNLEEYMPDSLKAEFNRPWTSVEKTRLCFPVEAFY